MQAVKGMFGSSKKDGSGVMPSDSSGVDTSQLSRAFVAVFAVYSAVDLNAGVSPVNWQSLHMIACARSVPKAVFAHCPKCVRRDFSFK